MHILTCVRLIRRQLNSDLVLSQHVSTVGILIPLISCAASSPLQVCVQAKSFCDEKSALVLCAPASRRYYLRKSIIYEHRDKFDCSKPKRNIELGTNLHTLPRQSTGGRNLNLNFGSALPSRRIDDFQRSFSMQGLSPFTVTCIYS